MATTRSTTSSIVPALILFVFVFAVFGMAATGPGSTTPIDPPVADSSVQRPVVRKRRAQKRMIYGFTFSHELVEWGKQHVGDTDDKEVLGHDRVRRSMGPLFTRCLGLWYRTTVHVVTYYSGPRLHQSDWCLTLADNISPDTATPPPREVIDQIKEALDITRDPEWHLFGGD